MSAKNAQLFYEQLPAKEKKLVHEMLLTEEPLKLPVIQKLAEEIIVGKRMISILLESMEKHELLQKKRDPDREWGPGTKGPQYIYEFNSTTVCSIAQLLGEKIRSIRGSEPSYDTAATSKEELLEQMFGSE